MRPSNRQKRLRIGGRYRMILLILILIFMSGYLLYALVNPEKF
ncbi:MAG: potassium-transporting ATPase subunit F [Massilioclostridium sp.]|nr:MAG: potassium-transporting ATPase subunit F [Massilioclostridium sp.]PWN00408.1 MAG: potassium-transporting ATPase subunit F [Massilioclostridium sp.]